MDASEAALLLSAAAAYDNRTVTESASVAWAEALADLRYEDAKHAVVTHYRGSREWIMPVDIVDGVKAIRARRISTAAAALQELALPKALDPDHPVREMQWRREVRKGIADGLDVESAFEAACRAVGIEPEPPATLSQRPVDELVASAARSLGGPNSPRDQLQW